MPLHERVLDRGAPAARERHVLLGREILAAEEQHQVLEPGPAQLGRDPGRQRPRQVDPAHLGAEGAGDSPDLKSGGHESIYHTRRDSCRRQSWQQTRKRSGFQAEVKQLLRLMIHSLYSNKEIFLRELVSNASDACDKLRFEAIAKPELLEGRAEPAIRIGFDKDARTLTVSDDGIGMSRDEAIEHLGTIARSRHARVPRQPRRATSRRTRS